MTTITTPLPTAPSFLDAVLDDLNALRAYHGNEPLHQIPRGCPSAPSNCPVALALGADIVSGHAYYIGDERFPTPHRLAKFIRDFDRGDYEELLA